MQELDNHILDEITMNYKLTMYFANGKDNINRGDDNWYKHCGVVIGKMAKEYPDSKKKLLGFLVAHIIELLLFEEKINVMNYIYSLKNIPEESFFEKYAKEYFLENTISTDKFIIFIAFKLNKKIIMILNNKNKWVEADPEEQRDIVLSLKNILKKPKEENPHLYDQVDSLLNFSKDSYNKIVGFVGYEKGNKDLAFKTKDMSSKRDTGAACYQAQKNKNLVKLNEIIGEEKYTIENTKAIKDKDGNIIKEAIGNVELCVLEEFILRYFNSNKKNGKKWFLTPEMAIYHKLYTVFV